MGKNVQIPAELFDNICDFFLNDGEDVEYLRNDIIFGLKDKLDKMQARQDFTDYKTAPANSAVREAARQKYLNRAGVSRSFRSDTEYHE